MLLNSIPGASDECWSNSPAGKLVRGDHRNIGLGVHLVRGESLSKLVKNGLLVSDVDSGDDILLVVDGDVEGAALEVVREADFVGAVLGFVPLSDLTVLLLHDLGLVAIDRVVDIGRSDDVLIGVECDLESAVLEVIGKADLPCAVVLLDPVADFAD